MARQTLNRYRYLQVALGSCYSKASRSNLVERRKKRADGPGAALKAASSEQQHCSATLTGVTVKQGNKYWQESRNHSALTLHSA